MILVKNLLITLLVLYVCFMIFKIISKVEFYYHLLLLFVLPPLIFRGKGAFEDGEFRSATVCSSQRT